MANAFWWAHLTLVRLFSTEDSLLPLSGVWFWGVGCPLVRTWLLSLVPFFVSTLGSHWRKTLPLPSVLALQVETPVVSAACIPWDTKTVFLSCWYEGPPAGWQISLPQGPALLTPVNGLSGPFALPLSVLGLQHDGTSHRASWGSAGYLPPTLPVPQGISLHPSPILPLVLTSPPWPPTLWQLEPYPPCSHIICIINLWYLQKIKKHYRAWDNNQRRMVALDSGQA